MITFQRGLFNKNKSLCDIQEMYFRTNAQNLDYENSIILNSGDFFSTDTYFNSISVGKIKKYTVIENVYLKLKAKGNFFLKIYHINNSLEKLEIFSKNYSLNELAELNIELEQWPNLSDGLLYFVIHAIDITSLYDFSYLTNKKPTQEVKLAIVITHFNRQQYLLPALQRIENELLNFSEFSNIGVIVSDNSQNLDFESSDKIKIYKNKNYGGSGGFTFGFLKAEEQGFTHCLFMDDDASTEIESIKRSYHFLSFLKDKNSAILGAMLFKDLKNIQHENGSKCKNGFKAIHNLLDLTDLKQILKNETVEEIEFGGWWFFAFKIDSVKYMPFPFFVRGDDVSFSLSNKFNIITFGGISSWQDDFNSKHNAYLEYLNIRSSFVMNLTSQINRGFLGFLKLYLKTFLAGIFTYRYNTCLAAHLALLDVLKGEIFWIDNIDMKEKRHQIKEAFFYEKKMLNVENKKNIKSSHLNRRKESSIKTLIRVVFLNGILLPGFLLKNETREILFYTPSLIDTFGYKKIRYYNKDLSEYVECERNFLIIFYMFYIFSFDLLRIFFNIPFFYSKYLKIYSSLTSRNFWKHEVFKEYFNL